MNFLPKWLFEKTRAYRRLTWNRESFRTKLVAANSEYAWVKPASESLKKVDDCLAEQNLDGAWFFLHEAMRAELPYLEGQELRNREQVLGCELTKIDSAWRKRAMEALLKEDSACEKERAMRLAKAEWLMDDYAQTQYYKIGLARDQMRNLMLISFAALLVLLALIAVGGSDFRKWSDFDWRMLLIVFIFGILGASFSATRKLADDSGKSRIPELAARGWITVARTVLGATPALFAYAFLRSGMLKILEVNIATVLAVSFAAGFSERFVLKMLETLDSKAGVKEDKKDAHK